MNSIKKKLYIGKPCIYSSKYENEIIGQLIIIDDKTYILSEEGEKSTTISPLTGNTVTQFVEVDENSLVEV